MKTRWAVRFLLFFGGFVVATALVLRTELAGRVLCEQGQRLASSLSGARVAAGNCAIEPFAARLVIEDLDVALPGPAPQSFTAKRLAVRFAPWLAFGGAVPVHEIELTDPRLSLDLSSPDRSPDSDDDPPAEDGCLAPLRTVPVGRLAVTGAAVDLRLPGGRRATVAGVEFLARRRGGRYAVEVGLAGALTGGPELSLDRLAAKAWLDPEAESLTLDGATLTLGESRIDLGGSVHHLCRPELDLTAGARVAVETLLALAGDGAPAASGVISVAATATGPASDPKLGAGITVEEGRIDAYEIGDLYATVSLAGTVLSIDDLRWPIEGGGAVVKGTVGLTGELPVEVQVRTEKLPFERLLSRLGIHDTPVVMAIDSTHRLAGKLSGGLLLAGESDIRVHGFRVMDGPWHEAGVSPVVEVPGVGHVDTPIRITAAGVELPDADIAFGPGTALGASVRLAFSEEEGLRIRARSGHFDLAHIASHVSVVPVAGAGPLEALIAGPYGNPKITGSLRMTGARLYGAELGTVGAQVTSWPGEGTLEFLEVDGRYRDSSYGGTVRLDFADESSLDAELVVREGGRLADVFHATSALVEPLAWLDRNVDGRVAELRGRIRGPFSRLDAEGRVRAVGATFMERPFDELSATLALVDGQRLAFEEVALSRAGGIARAVGAVHFPARGAAGVDATLDARGLPIRELLGSFAETIDLRGGAGGRLHLRGPFDALALTGELHADRLSAAGVDLPAARLSLEDQGGAVILRGPVVGAGRLAGSLRLVPGLPFEASFDLDVEDLTRYLPASAGFGGLARGVLEARGSLEDLAASRGTIALERLALSVGDYRVENADRVRATFDGPAFAVERLVARGPNTELSLRGHRTAAGALDLEAHGTVDVRLLDIVLPEIEHATGVMELAATLTGTGARPSLVGSARVERGAFRLAALPLAVQNLEADLAFSQNRVVVESATMVANGGTARVHGTVGIRSWAPERFELSADVERASWRLPEDFPAVVTGRLAFTGAWPDQLLLSGELHVDRLRYARELDLEAMVLDFGEKVRQAPAADDREWLRLDLGLVGGPDMRIENNLLRARLQFVAPPGQPRGRLQVVGSNVRIGLLGSVEIVEGLAFFRGNEYRLRQGVVGFAHRDRIDPEVDFTAETDVREYRVVVHGYGRLASESGAGFELSLSSDPPLPRADVLTLLTFGMTSRDPNAGANAAAGAGVAAEALWKVSGLDAQVRRWLPDSEVFRDPTVNVTSQYSEITGQLEPTATFETKFLDERLRLKASTPFATPKGRRASAEYRVDEHLTGQVVWENEETGYEAGDLGLDLKLRWEWE